MRVFHGLFVLACLALPAFAHAAGVKIGVLTDQTGAYADIAGPGSVAATKMAIEDFGGSVLGQPITMIAADTQNKPDASAATAKSLICVAASPSSARNAAPLTAGAVVVTAGTASPEEAAAATSAATAAADCTSGPS